MASRFVLMVLGAPLLAVSAQAQSLPPVSPYTMLDRTMMQMQKEAAKKAAEEAARRQAEKAARDAANPANDLRAVSTVTDRNDPARRVAFESKHNSEATLLSPGDLLKDEGVMDTGMSRN